MPDCLNYHYCFEGSKSIVATFLRTRPDKKSEDVSGGRAVDGSKTECSRASVAIAINKMGAAGSPPPTDDRGDGVVVNRLLYYPIS